MEERTSQAIRSHRINMNARKSAEITGVKDVRSFDEQEIVLDTEMGILVIRGAQLHVGRLTLEKGEVDITGRIDSLIYTERKGHTKNGESILSRLFQ